MSNLKSSLIYQCILPFYYFSKIFGLAPFNLPSKNGILKTSIFDYFVFFLSELLYLYLFYYFLFLHKFSQTNSDIFNSCAVFNASYLSFIGIISIFFSMLSRMKLFNIFKLVNEVDEILLTLGGIKFNFDGQYWFLVTYTIVNTIFHILVRIGTAVLMSKHNILDYKVFLAYCVFNKILWILMNQFLMLEYVVKMRFKSLNQVFW